MTVRQHGGRGIPGRPIIVAPNGISELTHHALVQATRTGLPVNLLYGSTTVEETGEAVSGTRSVYAPPDTSTLVDGPRFRRDLPAWGQ